MLGVGNKINATKDVSMKIVKTNYVIDGVEIDRVFLSKIFRSEDLGVSFESTLLTNNSITVEVTKENYSKVNSVVMELYKDNGDKIDDRKNPFWYLCFR